LADFVYAVAMTPFIILVIGVGIIGVLKIPTLVSHLFQGASGEGAAALQAVVRGATAAAQAAAAGA